MRSGECENCGADYGPNDLVCSYCGSPIHRKQEGYSNLDQLAGVIIDRIGQSVASQVNANYQREQRNNYTLERSRLLAGILAIILGAIGVQFFYLNKIGAGILCLIFVYTGIPALIGLIQGIIILKMSDAEFEDKYHVRAM